MKSFNFNFVFFMSDADNYKFAYSDLINCNNVNITYGLKPTNRFGKFLHKVQHSEKIWGEGNSFLESIWYNSYFKDNFKNKSLPLCFVFFAANVKEKYIKYLKGLYPTAKFVLYYTDLVNPINNASLISPNIVREIFDLIITYDQNDAINYSIKYFPTSYSDIHIPENDNIQNSDVYFLGTPKSRWSRILSSYETLAEAGLKCDFYILNQPKPKRVNRPGITYIDKPFTYYQNLQHVLKTKCLLEINQTGAVGASLRTWESIQFGKAFLTDNLSLKNSKFYDSNYMSFITSNGDLDVDFIKNYTFYDNPKKKDIRPIHFINYIQENL